MFQVRKTLKFDHLFLYGFGALYIISKKIDLILRSMAILEHLGGCLFLFRNESEVLLIIYIFLIFLWGDYLEIESYEWSASPTI